MVIAAAVVLFAGCKDDDEDDILPPDSAVDGLCINEVCSSGTDWVELYNASEESIDLSGYFLQDSKGAEEEYIFPLGMTIAAGEFLALEKDADFPFGISGDGDEIVLLDATGAVVDRITVPALEDGQTYARGTDGGETWEVKANGTKGVSNSSEPVVPGESDLALYINEVMCNPADGEFDFVEIYNAGNEEVDLGGFILQDEKGESEEYIIPAGTMVGAKSVILFTQAKEGNPDGSFGFGLGKGGDKVVFLDSERRIVDEIALPEEDMPEGTSYSRVGDGGATWEIMTPTGGKSNGTAPSLKGVVVLNEVYLFSDQESKDDLDYIELYNTSSQDVDLSGCSLLDDKMDEGDRYTFPEGTVIEANGFLTFDVDKDNTNGPAFGLGKSGDVILLYDKNGNRIDEVGTPDFEDTEIHSVGRKTDGGEEIVVFSEVSKNASNNGKVVVEK